MITTPRYGSSSEGGSSGDEEANQDDFFKDGVQFEYPRYEICVEPPAETDPNCQSQQHPTGPADLQAHLKSLIDSQSLDQTTIEQLLKMLNEQQQSQYMIWMKLN